MHWNWKYELKKSLLNSFRKFTENEVMRKLLSVLYRPMIRVHFFASKVFEGKKWAYALNGCSTSQLSYVSKSETNACQILSQNSNQNEIWSLPEYNHIRNKSVSCESHVLKLIIFHFLFEIRIFYFIHFFVLILLLSVSRSTVFYWKKHL